MHRVPVRSTLLSPRPLALNVTAVPDRNWPPDPTAIKKQSSSSYPKPPPAQVPVPVPHLWVNRRAHAGERVRGRRIVGETVPRRGSTTAAGGRGVVVSGEALEHHVGEPGIIIQTLQGGISIPD